MRISDWSSDVCSSDLHDKQHERHSCDLVHRNNHDNTRISEMKHEMAIKKWQHTIANTAEETHAQLDVWRCHFRLMVVARSSVAMSAAAQPLYLHTRAAAHRRDQMENVVFGTRNSDARNSYQFKHSKYRK